MGPPPAEPTSGCCVWAAPSSAAPCPRPCSLQVSRSTTRDAQHQAPRPHPCSSCLCRGFPGKSPRLPQALLEATSSHCSRSHLARRCHAPFAFHTVSPPPLLRPLSAKTPPWQGLVPSPVVLPLLPTPCGAGQRNGSKTLLDSHSPSSALTLVPALQSAPADFPVLQTLPPISCWIPVSLPSPASAKQSVKIEAGLHPNTIVNCSPERSLGRLRIAPGAGENECVQGGMNLKVMAGPPM